VADWNTIRLQEDTVPFQVAVLRRGSSFASKVKAEVDQMLQDGVISDVKQPTNWCPGMVVVTKRNSKIRICVDYTKLNTWVKCEKHALPHVNQILGQLSGAKYFSKLDAKSGFWHIKLSRESRLLTTFVTPLGRFCFSRLHFSICSAPEFFQRRMSQRLSGLSAVVCEMDDVLVFGSTEQDHKNAGVNCCASYKNVG